MIIIKKLSALPATACKVSLLVSILTDVLFACSGAGVVAVVADVDVVVEFVILIVELKKTGDSVGLTITFDSVGGRRKFGSLAMWKKQKHYFNSFSIINEECGTVSSNTFC